MADPDAVAAPYDVPPGLSRLRLRAEACARTEDDLGLLALVEQLRSDPDNWFTLWAPAAAIAAGRTGAIDRGLELLREAVRGGFTQPELFNGRLEELFADLDPWPGFVEEMHVGVPSPWEIIAWPELSAARPLHLDTIAAERLDELRSRLPAASASAWRTALDLLAWANRSWEHANDHVVNPDALEILDRVDAGERFACVEYSIVLAQALNAVGIPARRTQLLQSPHHSGVGRGHVVSEAWIDDLAKWVVLDGQNGAYWSDGDDAPLSLLELTDRFSANGEPSTMVTATGTVPDLDRDVWWRHFASAKTTGYAWGTPFSAVFQGAYLVNAAQLVHDAGTVYPDLDEVGIGVRGSRAEPRLLLHTNHPHATGFDWSGDLEGSTQLADPRLAVELENVGEFTIGLRVRTRYGVGRSRELRYRVN